MMTHVFAGLTPPGRGIPIINSTNGGPPSETVNPGQDHYQRLPITPEIVGDPDAFAVTLHGDSMEPDFHEGDVLVFAPSAEVQDGDECFVGFRTGEHAFKRVYDLGDGRLELRPLNTRRHRTQVVSTEADTGVARVVAAQHYLRATDASFAKATGGGLGGGQVVRTVVGQVVVQSAAWSSTQQHAAPNTPAITNDSASPCNSAHHGASPCRSAESGGMDLIGVEPTTSSMPWKRSPK